MNTNNQSVSAILASYNRGQGKTDTLPERYDYDGDQFIADGFEPVELSNNILRALFVKLFDEQANKERFLDAVSNDYLCPLHQKIAEKPVPSATKNPVRCTGKVISSGDYRKNAIKKRLDEINIDELLRLIDLSYSTTDSEGLLDRIVNMFETPETRQTYLGILNNEEKDKAKLAALESAGMTDIRRVNKSKLSGIIKNLTQAGPVLAVFDSLGLSFESMTPTESGEQIICFSEIAEEE